MKKKRTFAGICIIAVLVLAEIWLLGRLCLPKYASSVLEGAMTQEYYDEENGHDVIFIGDCEAYENFSPVTMWQTTGITSYVRGTPQQLVWQSYWLLAETFSIEQPKVVVYSVRALQYDEPQSEAYNRMTIDGMRLSRYKLGIIRDSMTEDETMLSYLFPIVRYHERITELTAEDFRCMFHKDNVTSAGYLMRADTKALNRLPNAAALKNPELSDICWDYLDRIRTLCEENGAELVLVKSSSVWPKWYDAWDEQVSDYAEQYGLTYINLLNYEEEIGIDWTTDTFDSGLHLNVFGAEKASAWFSEYLSDTFGLEDHRGDSVLAADWTAKTEAYEANKASQLAELEEYGYLLSWSSGSEEE